MIYLILKHSKTGKEKRSVPLSKCLTIGRGAMADIQLEDDETVSRLHALVVPRPDGRIELRDLSSTTGTIIMERGKNRRLMAEPGTGGAEKGRATLTVGEKFLVGRYCIEISSEDVLGEPSWRRKFHESLKAAEEEITEVDIDL